MNAYLLLVAGVIFGSVIAGWLAARRLSRESNESTHLVAVAVIVLGIAWFAGAWFARAYSDTDGFGSDAAGWFAHSGKWHVLLALAMVGHGLALGWQQIPASGIRRYLYFSAVAGVAVLVICRTITIYFLLGDGRRDANGYLRQSADYEFTCGAVALLNYLERFRGATNLTERAVACACRVTAEGATTADIVRGARHFGVSNATARVLTMPDLERQRLPVIVSVSTLPGLHHATLLVNLDSERAWFIDPAYGWWNTTRPRFKEIWYGKTVVFD